jgi:hypothetical protein
MKIKTVTYKLVKNLGNYQSETLEMSAEIDDGENPTRATESLWNQVNAILFPESSAPSEPPIPF